MKLKALKEKRYLTTGSGDLNHRATVTETESNERFIEGYASLFNHESKILAEKRNGELEVFNEIIEPGAFDEVLADPSLNCIHTVDHERGKMLARTISKTLQLSVDEVGLKYRFSVPNTTLGNDLYEMVKRGDLYESSFVFTVAPDCERWDETTFPKKRYISKVSGLYDTSTVTDGAYSNTAVKVARFLNEEAETPTVETTAVEQPAETKTEVKTEEPEAFDSHEVDLLDLQTLLAKHF